MPWLERFEDRLDQVVELLRELKAVSSVNPSARATEPQVRRRLDALAERLRLMERKRRGS
jgi:predicted trehalose synthase